MFFLRTSKDSYTCCSLVGYYLQVTKQFVYRSFNIFFFYINGHQTAIQFFLFTLKLTALFFFFKPIGVFQL